MNTQSKHSPLPWRSFTLHKGEKHNLDGWTHTTIKKHEVRIVAQDGLSIAHDIFGESETIKQANAAFIVRACNAHEELLNACKVAEATIVRLERHAPGSANGTLDVVRAAIAKAESLDQPK